MTHHAVPFQTQAMPTEIPSETGQFYAIGSDRVVPLWTRVGRPQAQQPGARWTFGRDRHATDLHRRCHVGE